jgi:hypothetical protein
MKALGSNETQAKFYDTGAISRTKIRSVGPAESEATGIGSGFRDTPIHSIQFLVTFNFFVQNAARFANHFHDSI